MKTKKETKKYRDELLMEISLVNDTCSAFYCLLAAVYWSVMKCPNTVLICHWNAIKLKRVLYCWGWHDYISEGWKIWNTNVEEPNNSIHTWDVSLWDLPFFRPPFFFLLTGPQCFISMYHNPISYNWFSCNFLCVYIYTYNCCPSSMKLTGE